MHLINIIKDVPSNTVTSRKRERENKSNLNPTEAEYSLCRDRITFLKQQQEQQQQFIDLYGAVIASACSG